MSIQKKNPQIKLTTFSINTNGIFYIVTCNYTNYDTSGTSLTITNNSTPNHCMTINKNTRNITTNEHIHHTNSYDSYKHQ